MSKKFVEVLLSNIAFVVYVGSKETMDVPTGLDGLNPLRVRKGEPFPVNKKQLTWLLDSKEYRKVALSSDILRRWFSEGINALAGSPDGRIGVEKRYRLQGYERRFLFFIQHESGYSGARMWDHQIALGIALAGHYVHVVTNGRPKFLGEWPLPDRFDLEVREDLKSDHGGYDAVIGSFPQGLGPAVDHARDTGIEAWGICYEPDNWLAEHVPDLANDGGLAASRHLALYLQCNRILCCSALAAEKLVEWDRRFKGRKIDVVEPAINLGMLKECAAKPTWPEKPRVVILGRVRDYKGWRDALKAVSLLPFPVDVDVIGDGASKAQSEAKNLVDRGHALRLHENVPEGDKWRLLAGCSTVLIASHHEGFGMVPAEALAVGKPVVAWQLDQLEAKWKGLVRFAKHGSAEDLARVLGETLSSPKSHVPDGSEVAVLSMTLERVSEDMRGIIEGKNGRSLGIITSDVETKPRTSGVSIITLQTDKANLTRELLRSLEVNDDKTPWELIIVDNASKEPASETWLKEVANNPNVRIIRLPINAGFNRGCNEGSKCARYDTLVLLNNDVTVTKGWLAPLLAEARKGKTVVSPTVLDSAGRNHWSGSIWSDELDAPIHINRRDIREIPKTPNETAVVSGCAMAIQTVDWFRLGGFDATFGPFYFEDADFCFRARTAGLKILHVPASTVVHRIHGTMTSEDLNRNYARNKVKFQGRWGNRPPKLSRPRVVAGMIAYQCEEWIAASIESIYDFCDSIIVVEGSVETTRDWSVDGGSADRTMEEVASVSDPKRKIKIVRGKWPSKTEMRNAYLEASHIQDGDWLFQVDADEIYHHDDLTRLEEEVRGRNEVVLFHHLDYWQTLDRVCVGEAWTRFLQVRLHRFQSGDHYVSHRNPCGGDGRGVQIERKVEQREDVRIHHFGYVAPDAKISKKILYYLRDPATKDRVLEGWYEKVWLGWRSDPDGVERAIGIHPYGGGSTRLYKGPIPVPAVRRYLGSDGKSRLPWLV